MKKLFKIVLLILLAFLLVLIRMFESELFYDPLIEFYKSDYKNTPLPEIDSVKLVGNLIFRFFLNTLISLAIIWLAFREKGILKLSSFLYSILFVALILSFSYMFFYTEEKNFLALFYVRRFLIQPIFLLVLLPAFYFQKKKI